MEHIFPHQGNVALEENFFIKDFVTETGIYLIDNN